jgi:hypothetical protein
MHSPLLIQIKAADICSVAPEPRVSNIELVAIRRVEQNAGSIHPATAD